MTLPEEERNKTANMKLSQLKNIMTNNYSNTPGYIKQIIQEEYDINCRITSTKHLASKQPKLIGCTALHLALMEDCIEGFETLLDSGADYTMKTIENNGDGLTVLHQVLENFCRNESMFRLESEFATSVLLAQYEFKNFANPRTSYGLSHFHAACLCNKAMLVKSFLENGESANNGTNVDSPVFPGYSPLHFAVRSYGFETVKILLENGADQHSVNAEGKTPLHMLIEQKMKLLSSSDVTAMVPPERLDYALDEHEKIMQLLYQQNNNDCVNFSAFHQACAMEDSSILQRTLENDVNDFNLAVDQVSPFWSGSTGLHIAALCNLDNLMLLLERGANIEVKNSAGVTAFDMCLNKYEAEDIHKILSPVKVWKDIVLSDDKTTLLQLVNAMQNPDQLHAFLESSDANVKAFIPFDSVLWPGFTLLHVAVQLFTSNLEIVNTCLNAGADVAARCASGSTALHLAFRREKKDVVAVLLQHCRDQTSNLTDNESLSLLHIACATAGHDDLVKSLLQSGVDDVNLAYEGKPIGSSFRTGFTPLHVAVVGENEELARELLERGADRYAADSQGFTPIHWVLAVPEPDKVGGELFLSASDVRESVVSGLSHLHVASYVKEHQRLNDHRGRMRSSKNYEFVKQLVAMPEFEARANVAVHYDEKLSPSFLSGLVGATPLHLAVQRKNWGVVKQLASSGSDVFARRANGSIPLYDALIAVEIDHQAKPLISVLKNSDEARSRARRDTGLTLLHLACFMRDMEEIENLLSSGENPNAQIHSDSPVWPGYTPLHVLVRYNAHPPYVDKLLSKLKIGFDYTLTSVDGDTAAHLAYKYRRKYWVGDLLRKHRNYNENPTNDAGLSYFHIACSIMDAYVVDRFIKSRVDVDHSIDSFSVARAGQSPLHLALSPESFYNADDASSRIVDWLLKRGAKVNVKDAIGRTPLHKAVELGRGKFDILKKIIEAGADASALDAYGINALDLLLSTGDFSAEQLQLFVRSGFRLNGFTPVDEDGYVSLAFINHQSQSDEKRVLFETMLEYPHTIDPDERGCTVVHSLVANHLTSLSCDEYAKLIEQLAKLPDTGCDVDDQDEEGRTALQVAADYANPSAVAGLLIAGADINVTDNEGYSAFDYLSEENSDDESTIMAMHVKKFEILGLHASPENRAFANDVFQRLNLDEESLRRKIDVELELAKNAKIPLDSCSIGLHDFLTEIPSATTIHALMGHQTLIQLYFRDFKDECFVQLRYLLRFQYRKAVARIELIERAAFALDYMSKCSVPCAKFIVRFFRNDELKNLIEARCMIIDG